MGLTQHSYDLMIRHIKQCDRILELGNQTIYYGGDYGKPAKPMFEKMGYIHISIDKNGQDSALPLDLSYPIQEVLADLGIKEKFDIVTDFGTSEHIENAYECWKNVHVLCKIGGLIICELPKTGSWKEHGFHYYTVEFFKEFAKLLNYEIKELGEHPAMGNHIDGWLIYCVLKKTQYKFVSEKQFNQLKILKS